MENVLRWNSLDAFNAVLFPELTTYFSDSNVHEDTNAEAV